MAPKPYRYRGVGCWDCRDVFRSVGTFLDHLDGDECPEAS